MAIHESQLADVCAEAHNTGQAEGFAKAVTLITELLTNMERHFTDLELTEAADAMQTARLNIGKVISEQGKE